MHQHICWIPLSFGLICFFILCVYVMEKGLFIHLYYDFQFICSIFETEYVFPMYSTNCSSVLLFPSQGSAVEQLPWYLWWAAADVHCSGGSWICQGHPREHAQHSGHWPVYGCGQAAVYCSHSREPPLFLPRWDNWEGFKKMFSLKMTEQHGLTVSAHANLMCVKCVFRFIFSLLPSFLSPFARIS